MIPVEVLSPIPHRRTATVLRADPRRVVAQLFLPGQEVSVPGVSRAGGVVTRCLEMDDDEAQAVLATVTSSYRPRHRDFEAMLDRHFQAVAHRVDNAHRLSPAQRRLIGAYFTMEYSLEAAALFNPSVVRHPVQSADPGELRFVMSARAVGEGHVSSIVFRTGTLTVGAGQAGPQTADVVMDEPSRHVSAGTSAGAPVIDREFLRREAAIAGAEPESLAFVIGALPAQFSPEALDRVLIELHDQVLTRVHADQTAALVRAAVSGHYRVWFDAQSAISERALMPTAAVESHGMEDARFVRFTHDDGQATYLATYTAYDGNQICSRRLQTDDFQTFWASPFTGRAATNKGMALFPRRVGGRYLALSRWDRENNAIAVSDDGFDWDTTYQLQAPQRPWELIQLGNCGSPIETPAGWLVLTHGVGAMREYSMGALLLDLDDPTRVLGRLPDPLLRPTQDERDGYVPNVVYSCGALVFQDTLLLPYGSSDSAVRFALVDLPVLVDRLSDGSVGSS